MAHITLGVNPLLTYASIEDLKIAGVTPGTVADDPRSDFQANRVKLVRAQSAIALGDAVQLDTGQTDEPAAVIPTSAADQSVEGIAHIAIPSGSYGWITIGGRVPSAKVAATTAANVTLMTTSTAGTLATSVGGTAANALAMGRVVKTLDAESGGLAEVYIY
jgi:hypothetical protein